MKNFSVFRLFQKSIKRLFTKFLAKEMQEISVGLLRLIRAPHSLFRKSRTFTATGVRLGKSVILPRASDFLDLRKNSPQFYTLHSTFYIQIRAVILATLLPVIPSAAEESQRWLTESGEKRSFDCAALHAAPLRMT